MTYYHYIPIMIASQNAQRSALGGTGEISGGLGTVLVALGIAVVICVIICAFIDRFM